MKCDIFINYRAVDVAYGAAAAYELLGERLGRGRIFLDNQSIEPGDEYSSLMRSALDSMRVLLVFIGQQWLAVDPCTGQMLIERREDWVRHEIRWALAREVPVIPVLLGGASLPDPLRLPPDIRRLVLYQAMELRYAHLGADIDRLSRRLADILLIGLPARYSGPSSRDKHLIGEKYG